MLRTSVERRGEGRPLFRGEHGDPGGGGGALHPAVVGDQHAEIVPERAGAGDVNRIEASQLWWLQGSSGGEPESLSGIVATLARMSATRLAEVPAARIARGTSTCAITLVASVIPGCDRLAQRRRLELDDDELDQS